MKGGSKANNPPKKSDLPSLGKILIFFGGKQYRERPEGRVANPRKNQKIARNRQIVRPLQIGRGSTLFS